jgi:FkbM family methyltransferase
MNLDLEYLKYLRYTKSLAWSKFLLKKSIPINDFYCSKKDNKVYIRSVKHFFSHGDFPFFFEGYKTYCWKFIDSGFQFVFENNNMYLKINELTIKVETLEELFIINEVFLENVYKIESKSDYIIFDIGMNIGITALYLSQFDHIKKIYGFEPFKPTFDCAKDNIMLNKKYMSKIEPSNFGLSNSDQFVHLHFDPFNKGNVGIKNTIISEAEAKMEDRIELREASRTLQKIMNEHPAGKFLVKLDCEGSEYDIIENLVNYAMLPAFEVFMIEWHKIDGYKNRLHNLIKAFRENNFQVLTIGSLGNGTGMIYCIHSN